MKWITRFFETRKQDLSDELQAHLQMEVADRISRGENAEEARDAAQRQFGNVAMIEDVTHGFWRWTRFEIFYNDLCFGMRLLRRSPVFFLTLILTLAIGVGATCAMFTVVDRVLLQPLPYRSPGRLVAITEIGKRGSEQGGNVAWPDVAEWQQRSRSFETIAFSTGNELRVWFLDAKNETIHVSVASVSANLFPTLGLRPALGRGFLAKDAGGLTNPDDAHAVLLSDAAWRKGFNADANVVGATTHINGEALTIVGVMPPHIVFPYGSGNWNGLPVVWRPILPDPSQMTRAHYADRYRVIARLNPGISLSVAQQELRGIQADAARAYTDSFDREHVTSVNLEQYAHSLIDQNVRKATVSLFGASSLLWMIGCVNAAGLMFARSTARQREFAIRTATGASRARILQQLLVESTFLSVTSSLVGLGLAAGILKAFQHGLVTQFNLHQQLQPDVRVAAALILLTAVATMAVALWPVLGVWRTNPAAGLRQGSSQSGSSRNQHRIRKALVVTEISLALTLLVGCGLLLRTIYALRHVALGFRTEHVVVANLTVPSYRFPDRNLTTYLYQPLIDRVKALPGVQSAALMTEVPLGHTFEMIFTMRPSGHSAIDLQRRELKTQLRAVGPEMQQVFGFRMQRGRFFNAQDTATSQAVVVVNRAFVRSYFGDDRDPSAILGESLIGFSEGRRSIVVGVLDDERQVAVAEPSQPEMEVSIPQITPDSLFYKAAEGGSMDVAVRTSSSPAQMIPALRQILRDAIPDLGASTFTTMDEVVDESFGSQKLASELLAIFAATALLLTAAGIYGVLAFFVAQRRQEIGVRMALGAQRVHIRRLILGQACWLLTTGTLLGAGLAWFSARGLKVFLYDVKTDDPLTGLAAAALLFGGGMVAALIPAQKAASVDPVEMIRSE